MKPKPIFNRSIFWDVDFEKLDYDNKKSWIIIRVFERGDIDDIRQCRRYYGDELVKESLLNAKYIMQGSLHLAAAVIDEPLENFRCYKLLQLNPTLYPY
jgi:hypothetical protein